MTVAAAGAAGPVAADERCALCRVEVAADVGALANGHLVCDPCTEQLEQELLAQDARRPRGLARVLAGNLVGLAVGVLVWVAVAGVTHREVGYVAALLGTAVGFGGCYGAGLARGPLLQVMAAAWALVGVLVAQYATAVVVLDRPRDGGLVHDVGRFLADGAWLSWWAPLWWILAVVAAVVPLRRLHVWLTR